MTQPPEWLPALRLVLSPGAQRVVEAHSQSKARIFFRQRSQRAPQILQLFGFSLAPLAGCQVSIKLPGCILQRAPPVIDELCSGLFAVHDAFSPANSK